MGQRRCIGPEEGWNAPVLRWLPSSECDHLWGQLAFPVNRQLLECISRIILVQCVRSSCRIQQHSYSRRRPGQVSIRHTIRMISLHSNAVRFNVRSGSVPATNGFRPIRTFLHNLSSILWRCDSFRQDLWSAAGPVSRSLRPYQSGAKAIKVLTVSTKSILSRTCRVKIRHIYVNWEDTSHQRLAELPDLHRITCVYWNRRILPNICEGLLLHCGTTIRANDEMSLVRMDSRMPEGLWWVKEDIDKWTGTGSTGWKRDLCPWYRRIWLRPGSRIITTAGWNRTRHCICIPDHEPDGTGLFYWFI